MASARDRVQLERLTRSETAPLMLSMSLPSGIVCSSVLPGCFVGRRGSKRESKGGLLSAGASGGSFVPLGALSLPCHLLPG